MSLGYPKIKGKIKNIQKERMVTKPLIKQKNLIKNIEYLYNIRPCVFYIKYFVVKKNIFLLSPKKKKIKLMAFK